MTPNTPELRQIVKAVAKPGEQQIVKDLLHGMIAPSLAEPGVRTYDLYETASGDGFYLFEVYESQEMFEQHKATPHLRHLLSVLPGLLAEPLEITLLTQIT